MELTKGRNFFKVMVPGFRQQLNLPPAVSKELEQQKSRRVTLESRIGSWKISLCKNLGKDRICLNRGWPEFVDRHALSVGDFVVFRHLADLRFKVYVFDSTACEKEEFPDSPEKTKMKKKKENPETLIPTHPPTSSTKENRSPYFVKTMVPTCAMPYAKIGVPTEFIRKNNLGFGRSVTLRDERGREWKIRVAGKDRRTKEGFPLRMYGRGWLKFYEANGLSNGDTVVFQLQRPLLTRTSFFFDVTISPSSSLLN